MSDIPEPLKAVALATQKKMQSLIEYRNESRSEIIDAVAARSGAEIAKAVDMIVHMFHVLGVSRRVVSKLAPEILVAQLNKDYGELLIHSTSVLADAVCGENKIKRVEMLSTIETLLLREAETDSLLEAATEPMANAIKKFLEGGGET